MKDSYTFDMDAAGLDAAYEKHYQAYTQPTTPYTQPQAPSQPSNDPATVNQISAILSQLGATQSQPQPQQLAADIARVDAKLSNPDFIRRAPEDVVEGEREKREDAEARGHKIADALARLDQIKK